VEPHEALEQHEKTQEATQEAEKEGHRGFARGAALLIAVLAALLAITTGVGNNATTETILSQGKAIDTYNEYQANSFKRHINTNDATLLRVLTAGTPRQAQARRLAKALDQAVKKKYLPNQQRLLPKAREYEHERDRAEDRHHTLQFAEGALQLAIVLSSVSVVVGVQALLWGGAAVGLVGLILAIDGFFLIAKLPF
jgi:hypothetical protein